MRLTVTVILIVTVVIAYLGFFSFNIKPWSGVNVGVFYYAWYGAPNSDEWTAAKFVDFPLHPLLGNYSSQNSTTIKNQLLLIRDLGVDFVVISWWGFGTTDDYGKFIDNAAKRVFEVAIEANVSELKFAIMVEPFNTSKADYNYKEIYSHIYQDFVTPYNSIYYYENGRPLICFFEDKELTGWGFFPRNLDFTVKTVGQANYVDWIYCGLTPEKPNFKREVCVSPRFDNSRIFNVTPYQVDANLSLGVYALEWRNAIKMCKSGLIDTVMITSWNEYPERTAIEPHFDTTLLWLDPYFLYDQTRNFVSQLRSEMSSQFILPAG